MAIPFGIYETSHWRVLHVSRELAISVREISSLWFKKINKYWDLLQLSNKASVNSVHAYKPILAFRRPKNLRDYLVRSSFADRTHHFSQTCDQT